MAKNASPQLSFDQALSRAATLCSRSECCVSDIEEKLYRWGVNKVDSQRIIDMLVDGKYIDESRYASAYAGDKFRFSRWGRAKIRAMLRMKHISDTDIEPALGQIDADEYSRILKEVIAAKRRETGDDNSYETRAKLIRFALQRGFEMQDIIKFVSDDA
ncbi:MAG: RecX family transcriptional regulator [Bacteroidaceae bacterium]|nr:RecX family transcriptional regulator [Bacteroidaceae bacterium]